MILPTKIVQPALVNVLLGLLALGMATLPAAAQQLQARVPIESAARLGPGNQYPIQFVIPPDGVVDISTCTQDYGWCEIAYELQTGWVVASDLEVIQPQPGAQGPQFRPLLQFLLGVIGLPQQQPQPQPPPAPQLPTPGNEQVCFYRDADFAGDAFCINMGAANPGLVGQWNDEISSIRMGTNASAQVCGDPNYGGWCQTYVVDADLTDFRNDSISSYRTIVAPAPEPPAPALPGAQGVNAAATVGLNARSGPNTQNPILFVIPQNSISTVTRCLSDYTWCQVVYGGQTGWGAARFLAAIPSGLLVSDYGPQLGIPIAQQPPPPPPAPFADQVCFYSDPNFAGLAFCVGFAQADFDLAIPWNNAISSIRVGVESSVQVCGDPNLAGWCQVYSDDVNLTAIRDNSISSYRTGPASPQPLPPLLGVDARATVSLNARSGPATQHAVLFVIPQNGLVSVRSCTGDYSWCELAYNGQTAWAAARFLVSVQAGVTISSYGAQLGIPVNLQPPPPPPPPPTPPPVPTPGAKEVCFYTGANYSGDALCVGVGQANYSLAAPWDNSISSIRLGAGVSVVVCGGPKLTTWCESYGDDVNLVGDRNNAISSYRVVAASVVPGAAGCVYELPFFSGAALCIGEDQTFIALPSSWDDRISSLRVNPGASVQVCRDAEFGGWCEEYTGDVSALPASRDNAISSLRTQ